MIENGAVIISLAAIIGFLMAWAIGANDVANAMGISVGSKILSLRHAIMIAAVFEALGSILASGNVTNTISHGLIDVAVLNDRPVILIAGMLSSLLSAAVWLLLASLKGWPVSTTHTIIGAVIGFGAVCIGMDHIYWQSIANILLSWLFTPLFSAVVSYVLFRFVQKSIFENDRPARQAKKTVPYYVFVVVGIMLSVILLGGLESLGIVLSITTTWIIILSLSLIASIVSYFMLSAIALNKAKISLKDSYALVEKIFGSLAIVTACAMAFAHGSNDVANAIAPLAAIAAIVSTGGTEITSTLIPYWIVLLGAAGIVTGLVMYGYKVIATVGSNITDLTPSRGFVAQLATASIVVISSGLGIPVSTTHILVGAVLGVGFARGIDAINMRVVREIFLSWFITFPAGMILSITFYNIILFFIK